MWNQQEPIPWGTEVRGLGPMSTAIDWDNVAHYRNYQRSNDEEYRQSIAFLDRNMQGGNKILRRTVEMALSDLNIFTDPDRELIQRALRMIKETRWFTEHPTDWAAQRMQYMSDAVTELTAKAERRKWHDYTPQDLRRDARISGNINFLTELFSSFLTEMQEHLQLVNEVSRELTRMEEEPNWRGHGYNEAFETELDFNFR